ncbi:MAG: bifunctional demethylmenaquinone methyltransferase/2-methoxy-6-polyprenyl-1,4-benzoquinol methylase UbiE [Ferruginibacter sp.]
MTQFAHDNVVPLKDSELSKKEQVADMFDNIAFRYDFLNRFLSVGIDTWWRKKAIRQLKNIGPKKILDVATGTADVAILAARILQPQKITGIDISDGMLNVGRKKVEKLGLENIIELLNGDSETINFDDNSFDAVTVAFGVRNFQHLEKGLSEIKRVLRPGGKLVVLEFSKPKSAVVKQLYQVYMNIVAPNMGKLFSKNRNAYKYLDESIKISRRKKFYRYFRQPRIHKLLLYTTELWNMQHLLRRKIIYFTIILLTGPMAGFSQLRYGGLNQPDHDSKLYHFGINLGVNKSHFNFTHYPTFLRQDSVMVIESVNSTGINLAWLVNLHVSPHFDFRTYPLNLTFSEKAFEYALTYPDAPAGESKLTIKKVQSITLSLPLQVKFSSDRIDNFKVYTIAGIKFDYDMAASAGKKNADDIIQLKKLDYSIEGGIGFHFYFPYFVLSPELKVDWGLLNLHSRNPNLKFSSNINKIYSRMIQFSLTVE